ncbi:MAG: hypothetical protein WCO33_02890 [bacterium]
MKKTLELATDFMFVCVLMFAFILPIIVSFNLIPKLYKLPEPVGQTASVDNAKSNVLGVNTADTGAGFDFVPELTESKFEKIVSNKKVGNAVVLDVELSPDGIVSRKSYVFFGNILNTSDRTTYKVSILKDADISKNLNLSLKLNSTSFNTDSVLVTLDKNQKAQLGLEYFSSVDINYNQDIKIVIERAE